MTRIKYKEQLENLVSDIVGLNSDNATLSTAADYTFNLKLYSKSERLETLKTIHKTFLERECTAFAPEVAVYIDKTE